MRTGVGGKEFGFIQIPTGARSLSAGSLVGEYKELPFTFLISPLGPTGRSTPAYTVLVQGDPSHPDINVPEN